MFERTEAKFAAWRLELIAGAGQWYKFWSIRLGAIGTTIIGWFSIFPDSAYSIWQSLPDAFTSHVPARYIPLVGAAIYVLAMISRFIKQHKLADATNSGTAATAASDAATTAARPVEPAA